MKRNTLAAAVLLLAVAALAPAATAQGSPVGGLRIADETGAATGEVPAPPGEKHFHFDSGVESFHIAFDYGDASSTEVQLRLLGPQGMILFQSIETYDVPGTHVVAFDNGFPLEDNEYVINAYISHEGTQYLADSLQLAVGEAEIGPPVVSGDGVPPDVEQAQATLVVNVPDGAAGNGSATPSEVPGGPSRWTLVLAALGVLALFAVVLWAGRSALYSR